MHHGVLQAKKAAKMAPKIGEPGVNGKAGKKKKSKFDKGNRQLAGSS
jgi:hypothetical protein